MRNDMVEQERGPTFIDVCNRITEMADGGEVQPFWGNDMTLQAAANVFKVHIPLVGTTNSGSELDPM